MEGSRSLRKGVCLAHRCGVARTMCVAYRLAAHRHAASHMGKVKARSKQVKSARGKLRASYQTAQTARCHCSPACVYLVCVQLDGMHSRII